MILLRLFIIALLYPFIVHGQDTINIKRQADVLARATFKGDVKIIIAYTYPGLITLNGGAEKMRQLITDRMDGLKKQGIIRFEGNIGSPGKFYTAGGEIHCLVPEEIFIYTAAGRYRSTSYFLGVSGNDGKNWTFLDVGNMPPDVLHRLVPNLNNDLIIPPPARPEFLAN